MLKLGLGEVFGTGKRIEIAGQGGKGVSKSEKNQVRWNRHL